MNNSIQNKKIIVVGFLLVCVSLIISLCALTNYVKQYIENDGQSFRKTIAVVSSVETRKYCVDYKVGQNEYSGFIELDYDIENPEEEMNKFITIYYDINHPERITMTDYGEYIMLIILSLITICFGISFVVYYIYKRNELRKNGQSRTVDLFGYDNGKMVFADNGGETKDLYYTSTKFDRKYYLELVENKNTNAELVISSRNPKIWALNLTKMMEEKNNEN